MNNLHAFAFLILAALTGARTEAFQNDTEIELPDDINEMLNWLPPDTETLIAANGPFEMHEHRKSSNAFSHVLKTHLVCWDASELLAAELRGHQIQIALEGSRGFRFRGGLGPIHYEGCHILRFEDSSDLALQKAMNSCIEKAQEVISIHDQQVAVFSEEVNDRVSEHLVTRPRRGMLMLATDREYLEAVLQRIQVKNLERAFPATLPEWQHVDFKANMWGIRHYRLTDADKDPTSPFHLHASKHTSDKEAVGFVFSYDAKEQTATVRYLSSASNASEVVTARWHNPPEHLNPKITQIRPGVVEVSSPVADEKVGGIFAVVLLLCVGHAICF